MIEGEPFIRFDWIADNAEAIVQRLGEHVQMTIIAVSVGFVISFGLAMLVRRFPRLAGPVIGISGTLYAIPSLALFALLVPFSGLSILTAEIALVSYTLLILVRNILAGLEGVPPEALEAADGMGFTAWQRFVRVEVPIALPVIIAGVRIATVTTIGLVTVTTLIGLGGLGYLIVNSGIQRFFATSIYTGVVLAVLLAILADALLAVVLRLLTPWSASRVPG